jgi:hypothetical protein
MNTFKMHALGYYPHHIRSVGTTDGTSTQIVCVGPLLTNYNCFLRMLYLQGESEHRRIKRFYARTNRNGFVQQITQHEQRQRLLQKLKLHQQISGPSKGKSPTVDLTESERLPQTSPMIHHHISNSRRFKEHIPDFLARNAEDPAFKVCTISIHNTGHI